MSGDADIEDAMRALLARRASGASICPSEVARALEADDWRPLMPRVREAAARLAARGCIEATQGHRVIAGEAITATKGPIRLRRGPGFAAAGRRPASD